MKQHTLYLASGSPRRWQLLQELGFNLIKVEAEIDETPFNHETAEDYVLRMALEKNSHARKVLGAEPEFPLLTADTTVSLQHQILGKPESAQHAAEILRSLSGTTHQVLTAVCVYFQGQTHNVLQTNEVTFSQLSDEHIQAYIASGEPMDKAGAYAIQGRASLFVNRIEGCYFNVVGLPLQRLYLMLEKRGFSLLKGGLG